MNNNSSAAIESEKKDLSPGRNKSLRAKGGKWLIAMAILVALIIIDIVIRQVFINNRVEGWETFEIYSQSNSGNLSEAGPVEIDAQDRVWTLDRSGSLVYLEPDSEIKVQNELSDEFVYDMVVDSQKRLWVSAGKTVYSLSPNAIIADRFEMDAIPTELAFDPKGRLWVGMRSENGGEGDRLMILESNKTWTRYELPSGVGRIRDISINEKGYVGVLSGFELYVLDPNGEWDVIHINVYPGIILLENDRIWIGAQGSSNYGVELYDLNGAYRSLFRPNNSELEGYYVNAMEVDNEGRVWLGTYGDSDGGVQMVDLNGKWITYTPKNSRLSSHRVTGIDFDSRGKIWVRAYVGDGHMAVLNSFDPATTLPGTQTSGIYDLVLLVGALSIASRGWLIVRDRRRAGDILTGFVGWYLVNITLVALMGEALFSAESYPGGFVVAIMIFIPGNLLALIILARTKATRAFAVGILLALAVSLLAVVLLRALF